MDSQTFSDVGPDPLKKQQDIAHTPRFSVFVSQRAKIQGNIRGINWVFPFCARHFVCCPEGVFHLKSCNMFLPVSVLVVGCFPDCFRHKKRLFCSLSCWYGWTFSDSLVSSNSKCKQNMLQRNPTCSVLQVPADLRDESLGSMAWLVVVTNWCLAQISCHLSWGQLKAKTANFYGWPSWISSTDPGSGRHDNTENNPGSSLSFMGSTLNLRRISAWVVKLLEQPLELRQVQETTVFD